VHPEALRDLTLSPLEDLGSGQGKSERKRGGDEMRDVTLRRRIATLVVMAFLSVMGATVAAATVADSADAKSIGVSNIWPRSD
jgi:hypothetical protein